MAYRTNSLCWLVLVAVAATLSAPSAAHAQFQSGFVGWTGMADTAADGLVNFAVYRTQDSDWTNDFTGVTFTALDSTLDTNTFEVLFFQVVNTDPGGSDDSIDHMLISDPNGIISSTGYIDGRVFQDNDDVNTQVGPTGNVVIGSETDPTPTPDDTLDGVPTRSDRALNSTPFASPNFPFSAVNPSSADTGVAGFMRFNFSPAIGDDGFSSVFFVTTDSGPSTYREGRAGNSDGFSNGDIPSPNPEPGPLVLVLVGVLGYLGYSLKTAKQARADAKLQPAPGAT